MGKSEYEINQVGVGATPGNYITKVETEAKAATRSLGWPVLAAVATVASTGYIIKKSLEKK